MNIRTVKTTDTVCFVFCFVLCFESFRFLGIIFAGHLQWITHQHSQWTDGANFKILICFCLLSTCRLPTSSSSSSFVFSSIFEFVHLFSSVLFFRQICCRHFIEFEFAVFTQLRHLLCLPTFEIEFMQPTQTHAHAHPMTALTTRRILRVVCPTLGSWTLNHTTGFKPRAGWPFMIGFFSFFLSICHEH